MSNLLDKASIVTTPTAYENGKILSVKPAPSLGVEKIVNGTFDVNVNGWVTNNANASFVWQINKTALFTSASFAYVRASPALNLNAAVYKVSFDILSFEGTLSNVHIGLGTTGNVITTTGSYTYFYTSTGGSTEFQIRPNSGGTGSITIDNVSVKEAIDGDFDFTRNSSATRVNSQGLIEDMQILSSNLVSNGDFATDSDWNKGSNWSILNGVATSNGAGLIQQSTSELTPGKTYKISFEITEYTSGGVKLYSGSGSDASTYKNTVGTHTNTLVLNGSTTSLYSNNFIGSIDNISVIEITDDTNLPRIDYTGGTGHWLFEPQSTNLIPYSEDFNSGWTQYGSPTINISSIISPNGTLNGSKITRGSNATPLRYQSLTSTGTQYTFSLYAKKGSVDKIYLDIGDVADVEFTLTDEWQRFQVTQTPTTYTHIDISFGTSVSGDHFFIFGAQLEQNSFATSYIPTSGAISTRLADAAFGAGSSDLINSTEGVLYFEGSALADDLTSKPITINDTTASNELGFYYYGNRIDAYVKVGNVNQFYVIKSIADATITSKIALKWNTNNFSLFVNGIKVATDTSGNVPIGLSELGFKNGGGANFYGKAKCVAVFKEALTDAELTCLTTI